MFNPYGEPDVDLGDYPLGYTDPEKYKNVYDDEPVKQKTYQFQFVDEWDLVSSEVFQRRLAQAMVKQQEYIDQLRNEIMEMAYGK